MLPASGILIKTILINQSRGVAGGVGWGEVGEGGAIGVGGSCLNMKKGSTLPPLRFRAPSAISSLRPARTREGRSPLRPSLPINVTAQDLVSPLPSTTHTHTDAPSQQDK